VRVATHALQLLEPLLGEQPFEAVGRERPADPLLFEDEVADLALLRERLELAVRQGLRVRHEEHALQGDQRDQRDDEVPGRESASSAASD
jgi:hypothetical protein